VIDPVLQHAYELDPFHGKLSQLRDHVRGLFGVPKDYITPFDEMVVLNPPP